jgi:hypothetical protein
MGSGKISQIENWVSQQAGTQQHWQPTEMVSLRSQRAWWGGGPSILETTQGRIFQWWAPLCAQSDPSFNASQWLVWRVRSWRTKWVSFSHSLHNWHMHCFKHPSEANQWIILQPTAAAAAAAAEHSLYLNWSLLTSQEKSVKYRIGSFRPTRVIPKSISIGSSCPVFGRNRGWKEEQVTDARRRSKITADQTLIPTDV